MAAHPQLTCPDCGKKSVESHEVRAHRAVVSGLTAALAAETSAFGKEYIQQHLDEARRFLQVQQDRHDGQMISFCQFCGWCRHQAITQHAGRPPFCEVCGVVSPVAPELDMAQLEGRKPPRNPGPGVGSGH